MAKRIFKTFSVIKNGCLDAERELLKDNVAFPFSKTQLKEMCWNQVIRIPFGPSPLFKIYLKILDFTDNFLSPQYLGK